MRVAEKLYCINIMNELSKTDYFNDALHHLGQQGHKLFTLNIGAMDGQTYDELVGYTNAYEFTGLYVEPIPYYYQKLIDNLDSRHKFENGAVSDYNGEVEMLTINPFVIEKGDIHKCFMGMSAIYPPKNGLGSEGDREVVEKYGVKIKVPCMTLDSLLNKHEIQHYDVIKIDAEGHDYTIFKQIDFERHSPKIVRLEWSSLTDEDKLKITNKFDKYEYHYGLEGGDIVGIKNDIYKELYGKMENNGVTIVTGLWNIKRDELGEGWSRSFEHYLEKFDEILKIPYNMIVFGDEELRDFVMERRTDENTHHWS